MAVAEPVQFDVIFAGGGLASTLLAVRLRSRHPDLRLLIVEQAETLGAGHTWSFHTTDLMPEQYDWIRPFVAHNWPDQLLKFPAYDRVVDVGYNTISAESFHAAAMAVVGDAVQLSTQVSEIHADHIVAGDGRIFQASCVIDGRGLRSDLPLALGYQKFVGLEVRTNDPHGEVRPTIMDATVSQRDGYRFIYTLPFDTNRILIEDTYYSDGDGISVEEVRRRVMAYATSRGWEVDEVVREESGVLPVVLGGDIDALWTGGAATEAEPAALIGLRAALFHPTTGYSLPDAVRLADEIADLNSFRTSVVAKVIEARSRKVWKQRRYFRMLNRMLFRGATPEERVRIFQHFYRLGTATIARFYAADLNPFDKLRILVGRPPIAVSRALPCLPESSVWPPGVRQDHAE